MYPVTVHILKVNFDFRLVNWILNELAVVFNMEKVYCEETNKIMPEEFLIATTFLASFKETKQPTYSP